MGDGKKENEKTKVKAVKTEIYSRVVGYYRPVKNWNRGKKEEFRDRNYLEFEKRK